MSTTQRALDTAELEQRVKEMYREVAEEPFNEFHFETGRPLAERLGYPADQLDVIPDPQAREPHAALEAGELYAAIAALPADFRDVLVAVDVTGLTYEEAARALRIRTGTVMSRLYRARQQVVRRIDSPQD